MYEINNKNSKKNDGLPNFEPRNFPNIRKIEL